MNAHFKKYLLLLFIFTGIFSAQGYQVNNVPHPKTTDADNFVCNPDGILDNTSVVQINAVLQSLEAETKAEVAVVVLGSIEDDGIEDFAVRLFQEWGIGKKGLDNGLLILFVLDQRAVRFETGYGLEGVLPDAICKRIQTLTMIPAFKNGDYDKGLLQAIEQVAALIRKEPVPELQGTKEFTWFEILLLTLIAYVFLLLLSFVWISISVVAIKKNTGLQTNPDRYRALNSKRILVDIVVAIFLLLAGWVVIWLYLSFGYIFFLLFIPFAVIPVNWFAKTQMRKFRNQPIACKQCGTMMHVLSEKKDNAYLTPGQRLEEKIHSMDYDVFLCEQCHHTVIFGYDMQSRNYTKCPQCKVKAWGQTKSYTLAKPTFSTNGVQRTVYTCLFCDYTENKDETLPRLHASAPSYSSGGSSFSGWRSSGGRSSSGGSFGGGRSGGGGSTSRW
jgi:uncharacterized protein